MSNTTLESVTALANPAARAGAAKLPTSAHAAVLTISVDRTRVPAEGSSSCTPASGFTMVGVDGSVTPGSPSWSPPV